MNKTLPAAALAIVISTAGLAAGPASAASAGAGAGLPSKSYTTTQVAKHKKATDCWTIINGSVYNLTRYIKKHPGGKSKIIRICGKNGSGAFGGEHSGAAKPAKALRPYRIGSVK